MGTRGFNPISNDIATGAVSVSPSDSVDLTDGCRGLFIGGAGAVKVTMASDETVTFSGCSAGQFLPIAVKRVWSTGTAATLILALY